MNRTHACLTAVAAVALLSACGGGNNYPDEPSIYSGTVPASALASPTAYTQFAASLQINETGLPLDVTGVVAPSTETGAPVTL